MTQLKTVAIIPARGGSKGLRKKNIQLLAGEPLLAHTIKQVKNSSYINKVIVSTDDSEIREIALKYGAEVPFMRPDQLSLDSTKTDEVLQHAILWLDEHGFNFDIVLWCHSTLPFRRVEWLDQLVLNLVDNPEVDSSFIVCATHKNYWIDKDGMMMPLSLNGLHPGYAQRQRMEPVFQEECGLGCATRSDVIRQGRRVGKRMYPFKVYEHISMTDIHDEFDLWLANMILTKLNGKIFKD